jgi:hypothetical protein
MQNLSVKHWNTCSDELCIKLIRQTIIASDQHSQQPQYREISSLVSIYFRKLWNLLVLWTSVDEI